MTDLFIKARQNWFPTDPDKAKAVYKKYDVVHLSANDNNGKGYGSQERWPHFVIIRINRPIESLKKYIEYQEGSERRLYRFDFDARLNASELAQVKDPDLSPAFIPVVRLNELEIK